MSNAGYAPPPTSLWTMISSPGHDDPGDRRVRLHRLVGGARPPGRRRATGRARPRRRSVAPAHDRRRRRHLAGDAGARRRHRSRGGRPRACASTTCGASFTWPPGRCRCAGRIRRGRPDQRRRHHERVRGGADQRRPRRARRLRLVGGGVRPAHALSAGAAARRRAAPPTTHYGVYKVANEAPARVYWEEHRVRSPASGRSRSTARPRRRRDGHARRWP